MKKTIFIFSACFALWGCKPTLIAEFEDRPVVSCYLDAGSSPVLTVAKLIAFRDDVTYSDEDVNALSITITDQTAGVDYPMQPVGEGGRYACAGLTAETGHTYSLSFMYNGIAVWATTTVPEPPQGMDYPDGKTISVMVFDPLSGSSSRAPGQGIEIEWRNDERNYYIVEGFLANPEEAWLIDENDTEPATSFKLDYTQGNSATLSQEQFHYFGNYEVSLIRIHAEYAVMSQGSSDTSTSLVDIRGNIEGGYGIFTGINRDTETVSVTPQTNPF